MTVKNPTNSRGFVVFSMILVYSVAWAQSGDELYQRLKQNPTLSKPEIDKAMIETVNQDRVKKLNEKAATQKQPVAQTAPKQPVAQAAPVDGPPPSNSDSPKVGYDPFPEEITFPGEAESPTPTKLEPKKR